MNEMRECHTFFTRKEIEVAYNFCYTFGGIHLQSGILKVR